jgi:hypothetical protein
MALRVTRQQIEILREPFDPLNQSVTSTLTLTDEASASVEFARSASDALALTSQVALSTVLNLSASSSLSLTDSATGSLGEVYDVSASSTLSLTDLAECETVLNVEATSTLSLTHEATASHVVEVDASNTLSLTQTLATQKTINREVISLLQETTLEFLPGTIELVEVITGLNQEVGVTTELSLDVVDALALSHDAWSILLKDDAIELDAENTLTLDDTAILSTVLSASNTLTLTQSATGVGSKPVESELALTTSASATISRFLDAESELEFSQFASVILIPAGGVRLCEYSATIEPLQGPYPGVTSRFALIYPADGAATDTVELRPPTLGNKDRLSFTRISRESRGGTLIVYADPIWPKVQTLLLTLTALTREQADEVIRFKEEHLGQEIILSDWEQRQWRGVITTPEEPIIEDTAGRFTTSFTFEGELIDV